MEKILLREKEGQQMYSMGRTKFRQFAASAGAVIHIGHAVRYDKAAIDAAIDALREAKNN
jgi:hypothetical protein